jgi:hypothetical protein
MTLAELKIFVDKLVESGEVNPNLPVKFRCDGGKQPDIDYAVMSNDRRSILFAEEWF